MENTFSDEDIPKEFDRTFTHKGVTATLITDHKRLAQEGQEMHHCVGSYGSSIKKGNILVYSLTDGKNRSTLSINIERLERMNFNSNTNDVHYLPHIKELRIGQHTSHCNARVEKQDFLDTASELVAHLNVRQREQEKVLA